MSRLGVLVVAALAAYLASAMRAAEAASNCAPYRFSVSTAHPFQASEACRGTVVVYVRIGEHGPFAEQSGGARHETLVSYGVGAAIRLTQRHGVVYVTAATAAPRAQSVSIRFRLSAGRRESGRATWPSYLPFVPTLPGSRGSS